MNVPFRKVCVILNELNLEYKTNYVELGDTKKPEYVKVNPNGRLPAIRDPNTGTTLWEVCWITSCPGY